MARKHGSAYDQLQEDNKRLTDRVDELTARVDELFAKVQSLTVRDGLWQLHAVRLETQVVDMGGTPHERPAALR